MSSPVSCDSHDSQSIWMNYSSNSSDDLSAISDRMHCHQQQDSSEESSLEFDSSVSQSTPKAKRNFNLVSDYTLAVDRDTNVATNSNSAFNATAGSPTIIEHNGTASQSKRLRGKSINATNPGCVHSTKTPTIAPTSGSFKRKALLHRNGSLSGAICDIRMIDFAHTTFVRKSDQASTYTNSTTVQHQGPDNGFLRGIESLRRLLTEIANDEELECDSNDVVAQRSIDTSVDGGS